MNSANPIDFNNSYANLPDKFYARQPPTPVARPELIEINTELARSLGIEPVWLESPAGLAVLAGNEVPEGAEPISSAYAGHQFGSWNPQLGDGRAVLLGEVIDTKGSRFDIQLKGSGPTHWSRGGDGRSPVGPVLREYLVSEAMHRLGVPTTRALAAISTGERVLRDEPLPGAILTRVASSHIRIGTFEYFSARKDIDALKLLVEQVIKRHYPHAAKTENPCHAMLDSVVTAQAKLVAQWQLLGFIHGVMNTDNMLLSGETVDYGPCAFIDDFHPDTVFSSIDHGGRYAYRNQPGITHWNLAALARTLVPLLDDNEETAVALAQESINAFPERFLAAHQGGMNRKLGLSAIRESDEELAAELLAVMADEKSDFTLTFRCLNEIATPGLAKEAGQACVYHLPEGFSPWLERWQARLSEDPLDKELRAESMAGANPVFIPRNHLVEAVIHAAVYEQDLKPFHQLHAVLDQPSRYNAEFEAFARPPNPDQVVKETFCGT